MYPCYRLLHEEFISHSYIHCALPDTHSPYMQLLHLTLKAYKTTLFQTRKSYGYSFTLSNWATNQRAVLTPRDHFQPIRGQYWHHVTISSQSEGSIDTTWLFPANQRAVLPPRNSCEPMRHMRKFGNWKWAIYKIISPAVNHAHDKHARYRIGLLIKQVRDTCYNIN